MQSEQYRIGGKHHGGKICSAGRRNPAGAMGTIPGYHALYIRQTAGTSSAGAIRTAANNTETKEQTIPDITPPVEIIRRFYFVYAYRPHSKPIHRRAYGHSIPIPRYQTNRRRVHYTAPCGLFCFLFKTAGTV